MWFLSETVSSDTVSHAISDAISDAVSDTVSGTVSDTVSDKVSYTFSYTISNTISKKRINNLNMCRFPLTAIAKEKWIKLLPLLKNALWNWMIKNIELEKVGFTFGYCGHLKRSSFLWKSKITGLLHVENNLFYSFFLKKKFENCFFLKGV